MTQRRATRAGVLSLGRARTVLVICFAAYLSAVGPASGADAEQHDRAIIEAIIADWRGRAESLHTLHCVAEGTATAAKGCYNGGQHLPKGVEGDVPAEDHTYACRYDWTFDFEKGRFRVESNGEIFSMIELSFVPNVTIRACDGLRKPRMLAPRALNSNATHTPGMNQPEFYLNLHGPTLTTLDVIVLLAHGTVPADGAAVTSATMGSVPARPNDLVVHGLAEHGDRECVVLRAPRHPPTNFEEYWVDRGRKSAVVHWQSRMSGRKTFETNIDYQEISGLWLPRLIDVTKYRPHPENPPERTYRLRVTEIVPNSRNDNDTFTLEPDEGMLVRDEARHERYRYTRRAESNSALWSLAIAAIVAFLLAMGVVWRSRQRRAVPPMTAKAVTR